jgi:DNA-binding NtrC family response regulator
MSDTGALVYVVDDDPSAREGVSSLIRSAGLMAKTFASAQEFLATPRAGIPSCLVLDVNLPGLSGLDLQQELAKSGDQIPIIFLTGHGDIPMTVRAVKAGAVDFLTKPFDDEDLLNAVRQCITSDGKQGTPSEMSFGQMQIVGNSRALKQVLELVRTVAPSDSTVLLLGETGTGKELIARAIHNCSPRKKRPFVKLNCAAIPTGLLESELFGHERGAFTGALTQKIGRLELANQGSLFLDEIGDIPLDLQPKLLRVLQEREFERLGSTQTKKVDVRIVAATHCALEEMVVHKQFRLDLYYRLNVFPISVPPLRERREDIPLLARHFVQQFARRMHKTVEAISSQTMEALVHYPWPGNVRELQNVIERSVVVYERGELSVSKDWLAHECFLSEPAPHASFRKSTIEEREMIAAALAEAHGRISGPSGAAAKLGIPASTLESKIRAMKINKYSFRAL